MSGAPAESGAGAAAAAAERWRAQEQGRKAKEQKVVDDARAASDGAQGQAGAASDGARSQPVDGQQEALAKLAFMGWTAINFFTIKLAPRLELTQREKLELVEASVPVLEKYLPDDIEVGPEQALLFTAAVIYGGKLIAPKGKAADETSRGESPPRSPAGIPPGQQTVDAKKVG